MRTIPGPRLDARPLSLLALVNMLSFACGPHQEDVVVSRQTSAEVLPSLEDALACVGGYVAAGHCDWAHWSELYDVCGTYGYAALDDDYLLGEVREGRCSSATWPAIRAHIVETASIVPPPPPTIEDFGDAIDCVEERYVATGHCDWAHWSELYEVCQTYAYTALDDDYLLHEVAEGRCNLSTWPAIRQHVLTSAGLTPPPGVESAWAGHYVTETEYWGGTFSPLIIGYDGKVSIAGTIITPTYDSATSTLSFDWTQIAGTQARGTLHFRKDGAGTPTVSGGIYPRPEDGPVGFSGARVHAVAPLSAWAGEYTTDTRWWGGTFGPLVVHHDGTVEIAGTRIVASYDELTSSLSFDWTDIRSTRARGQIWFSQAPGGGLSFAGAISPRPQDGPVEYAGTKTGARGELPRMAAPYFEDLLHEASFTAEARGGDTLLTRETMVDLGALGFDPAILSFGVPVVASYVTAPEACRDAEPALRSFDVTIELLGATGELLASEHISDDPCPSASEARASVARFENYGPKLARVRVRETVTVRGDILPAMHVELRLLPPNLLVNPEFRGPLRAGWRVSGTWVDGTDRRATGLSASPSSSHAEREQLVDLTALGYGAAYLDSGPPLYVHTWANRTRCADAAALRVDLLDAFQRPLASWHLDELFPEQACVDGWLPLGTVLKDYPAGVRYARWTESAPQAVSFEDPYLSVLPQSVQVRLGELGGGAQGGRLRALAASCGHVNEAPCVDSTANTVAAVSGTALTFAGFAGGFACFAGIITAPVTLGISASACAIAGVAVAGTGAVTTGVALTSSAARSCKSPGLEIRDNLCVCPVKQHWDAALATCSAGTPSEPSTQSCQNNVRLLAFYTEEARTKLGGTAQIRAHIEKQVEQLNDAMAQSKVTEGRVELVAIEETALKEVSLDRNADGLLDSLIQGGSPATQGQIRARRKALKADLVTVFTGSLNGTCGIGNDELIKAKGYSLVSTGGNCDRTPLALAHELGHNFGLHHDRHTLGKGLDYDAPHYNYGYINRTKSVVSVMSYASTCARLGLVCSRVALFSSPALRHDGSPMGTAIENDAQALRESWSKIREYQECPAP